MYWAVTLDIKSAGCSLEILKKPSKVPSSCFVGVAGIFFP